MVNDFAENGESEIRIRIRDATTGEILPMEEMPKSEDIDAWIEAHPGHEVTLIILQGF